MFKGIFYIRITGTIFVLWTCCWASLLAVSVSRILSSKLVLVWAQAAESSMELEQIRLSTFPLSSSDWHRPSQLRVIMASLFCCHDCNPLRVLMSFTNIFLIFFPTLESCLKINKSEMRVLLAWLPFSSLDNRYSLSQCLDEEKSW